jgi:hypothetical protein
MPNDHLIVACYTAGDYEQEAKERLLPSLKALGLPHDVRQVDSFGSWIANGFRCQEFLFGMHHEKPNTDFLFLDVDCVVHTNPWPFLQRLDCDLAAHLFRGRELLTGTLYLPSGEHRERLLQLWIDENKSHKNRWDQRNLQDLLSRDNTFKFVDLPAEYCCIFDIQRKHTPRIAPVIEHFQASRRFKKRVEKQTCPIGY